MCNFAFPTENPRPMLRIAEGEDIDMDAFNGLTEDIEKTADDYFEEPKGDGEERDKDRSKISLSGSYGSM